MRFREAKWRTGLFGPLMGGSFMVTLGVILLVVGLLVNTGLPLVTIGIILIVLGLILNFVPIRNGKGIRVF